MKKIFTLLLVLGIIFSTSLNTEAYEINKNTKTIIYNQDNIPFSNGNVSGMLVETGEKIDIGVTNDKGELLVNKDILKSNKTLDIILTLENEQIYAQHATSIQKNGKINLPKEVNIQFQNKALRSSLWNAESVTYIGSDWYLNGKTPTRYGVSISGTIGSSTGYHIEGDATWMGASYSSQSGYDFGTNKIDARGTGYIEFYTYRKVYEVVEVNQIGTMRRTRYLVSGTPTSSKAEFSSKSLSALSWSSAESIAQAHFGAGYSPSVKHNLQSTQSLSFSAPIPKLKYVTLNATSYHTTSKTITYSAWDSKSYLIYGSDRMISAKY